MTLHQGVGGGQTIEVCVGSSKRLENITDPGMI
jgi:hypothetical protein